MKELLAIVLVILLCSGTAADPTCSWQNCAQTYPDQLNIHLICHSHDDMGWLKTVDQYYSDQVQYIISNVVDSLRKNPDRRFSQCETGFFWRWYSTQSVDVQNQILTLVQNGQLEFIGGGWTQNDEAATHYVAIIDQMTLGLSILNQLYGECGRPKIAWQIDPFGHSREQASLFAQEHLNILSGSFYLDNYSPPDHFCFDAYCGDEQITDGNVARKAQEFINFCREQLTVADIHHFVFLMGHDEGVLLGMLAEFPKLTVFVERIQAIPKIKDWIEKRPQAPYSSMSKKKP